MIMERARFSCLHAIALQLAVCAAVLPLRTIAADVVNLEGTWRIAAPQSSFKPEGGRVPLTAEGRKRYQQNKLAQAKGNFDDYDYATSRCASPGLPRLMLTPGRLRFWQRPGIVTIRFETNRLVRQIDMGGLIPQSRGNGPGGTDEAALVGRAIPISTGKWEGDALVVTTGGFPDNTLVDDLVPHGYDMKLTERFRLRDQNTLEDQLTIEDPEFFTKPWQTVVSYKRQPDEIFPESVCLDGLKLDHWPPARKGR